MEGTSRRNRRASSGGPNCRCRLNSITVGGDSGRSRPPRKSALRKGKREAYRPAMLAVVPRRVASSEPWREAAKARRSERRVGGGAGTGGAVYTGNRDIILPAESAVSFELEAPLRSER